MKGYIKINYSQREDFPGSIVSVLTEFLNILLCITTSISVVSSLFLFHCALVEEHDTYQPHCDL